MQGGAQQLLRRASLVIGPEETEQVLTGERRVLGSQVVKERPAFSP
jgi:hypothetical protein